jgi:hypothetical protein
MELVIQELIIRNKKIEITLAYFYFFKIMKVGWGGGLNLYKEVHTSTAHASIQYLLSKNTFTKSMGQCPPIHKFRIGVQDAFFLFLYHIICIGVSLGVPSTRLSGHLSKNTSTE